jgi:Modifier of rudimentary (Mod(r)) protein
VFQTTQGDTLIVRVHVPLTSSFASFCPAMSLAGVKVRHPWVEERTMRINGYDPIQTEAAWKASGLSLGQVVHEVVKYLQLNPPEILEITDPGLQAIQPASSPFRTEGTANTTSSSTAQSRNSGVAPPSYDTANHNNNNNKQPLPPQLPPAPNVPLPRIVPRDCLDLLEGKSTEELEQLLTNDLEFLTLVHTLPVSQEIRRIAISKVEETRAMAEDNLEGEHILKSTHGEIQQLQTLLKDKLKIFQSLETQQNSLCAPPDVRQTLAKLKEAKKQAFEESEAFAEAWVDDGATNVDQFVKEFIAQRKIHHERAAKMEILERQERQEAQPPRSSNKNIIYTGIRQV